MASGEHLKVRLKGNLLESGLNLWNGSSCISPMESVAEEGRHTLQTATGRPFDSKPFDGELCSHPPTAYLVRVIEVHYIQVRSLNVLIQARPRRGIRWDHRESSPAESSYGTAEFLKLASAEPRGSMSNFQVSMLDSRGTRRVSSPDFAPILLTDFMVQIRQLSDIHPRSR